MRPLLLALLICSGSASGLSIKDIPVLPPSGSQPVSAPSSPLPTITPLPAPPVSGQVAQLSESTLPFDGQLLPPELSASLGGPERLKAGERTEWSFMLSNSGPQLISLDHGACDVRFEVLSSSGQVLRPDPKDTLCTMQRVRTQVAPGQSTEVQKIVWDGQDAEGKAVPAGMYTLRAIFHGAGSVSAPVVLIIQVE